MMNAMPSQLESESSQVLVRITRASETGYREEELADVRFVPLIGEHGFAEDSVLVRPSARRARRCQAW